jgi:HD-like signal output (HDOD) protein
MKLEELLASSGHLPSIPKVIALLLNELGQEEPDLRKITQMINTDPVLTTRLLRLANSAQFQLANKISSVSEALALLGLRQVHSLATAAAVAGAFKGIQGMDMNAFWRYSLNVARLSRALAGLAWQNQAAAFTAGLIHATGELVMRLAMPAEMTTMDATTPPLGLKRASAERKLFGYSFAQVGAGFAREWQFPLPIVEALEHQEAPFENDACEPLAGVLHLAVWRSRAHEDRLDEQRLIDYFPDRVALALKLDRDMVFGEDPAEWSSQADVDVML